MNRYLHIPIKGAKHPDQPVQGEAAEIRVTHPGKVSGSKSGQFLRLPHGELPVIQLSDNAGSHDGLTLLQVSIGIAQVPEQIAASSDKLELVLTHGINPSLNRFRRS